MALNYLVLLSKVVVFSCLFPEMIFNFENLCPHTIWLSASPGIGDFNPERGPGTFEIFRMQDQWSGMLWARTGCNNDESFKFTCETGDCGSGTQDCQDPFPKYPVTLIFLNINSSVVFYEVNLSHGHNVRVQIQPDGGSLVGGSGPGPEVGCAGDISNVCPNDLVVKNKNGAYVACSSPCDAYNQCGPNQITDNFKKVCPKAHAYITDPNPPIYQCIGAKSYTVTFCPPL